MSIALAMSSFERPYGKEGGNILKVSYLVLDYTPIENEQSGRFKVITIDPKFPTYCNEAGGLITEENGYFIMDPKFRTGG